MEPQTDTQNEMWRYSAIPLDPLIARPDDWFLQEQYVVCEVWKIWVPARIIELGGGSPKTFMLCMHDGENRCGPGECDSSCVYRYWANVSQGSVLNKKDLMRILLHPEPIVPDDSLYKIVDYELAGELLDMIFNLEERQN